MYIDCRFPLRNIRKCCVASVFFAFAALLFFGVGPAAAQSAEEMDALKAEIQVLKQGQQAIQRDLAVIKQLLQQRPQAQARAQPQPFKPMELSVAGAPALGEQDAVVTMIEFTDYQCPFCARHNAQTKPQLVKDYVETGKLRYVLREFPIESIHPHAMKAAEAALCAGDQGKYWTMNALFFQNQRQLQPEQLMAHAEGLELDMAVFKDCFESAKYAERVRNDLRDGMTAGVRGTPSFFLGLTDPDDPSKIKAIKFLRGAQPYAAFKREIDSLIAQSAKGS